MRNLFYNEKESDIDFLTLLTLKELQKEFPKLNFTERGLEFGVCRVNFKGRQFDFSLCDSIESFNDKLVERDFTVNSLYSDGISVFYPHRSMKDLQSKTLYPATSLENQFINSDKFLIRVYRLIGEYGFDLDESVVSFLKKYRETITDIHHSMLMDELYRMLKGKHVLKSLHYLWSVYFENEVDVFLSQNKELIIPSLSDNLKARIIFIDFLSNSDLMVRFLELFDMPVTLSVNFEESRYLINNPNNIHPSQFSLYLLVKRYEFNDDPKKLSLFLQSVKNKK